MNTMIKMIGYERADFTSKEGVEVKGINVYLARTIDPARGKGQAVERCYITDAKIEAVGMDLEALLGKPCEVYYNRYGKVSNIVAG